MTKIYLYRVWQKFSAREQKVFVIALCLGVVGLAGLLGNAYRGLTVQKPANGGRLVEGVVGQPTTLNPLVAPGSDADQDLRYLVHAGLLKVGQDGKIAPDLAESLPQASADLKTYTVKLKKNIYWQDGKPITADDVVYTVKSILDKNAGSSLRNSFKFTKVEKLDDLTLQFKLREPAITFTDNLLIPVIPQHVSNMNDLKPVGAGPYKVAKYRYRSNGEIAQVDLEANKYYSPRRPYISKITIKFYRSSEELIAAYKQKRITSFGILPSSEQIKLQAGSRIIKVTLPQYQAVFFNQDFNDALKSLQVRQALQLGTDRGQIIEEVYNGQASGLGGPVVGGELVPAPKLSREDAGKLLDQAGWTVGPDNLRYKGGAALRIILSTSNSPTLVKTAQILKQQWAKLGIDLVIQSLPYAELDEKVIRPRLFHALLIIENIGHDPDPYPFWHSSQVADPGLNFTGFKSPKADEAIVAARTTADPNLRKTAYAKFVDILNSYSPAVFLVEPLYLYVAPDNIKNLNLTSVALPHERFAGISEWYINTRRDFK